MEDRSGALDASLAVHSHARPVRAYFEYLHWQSVMVALRANQVRRVATWDQIRISVDAAVGLIFLASAVRLAASVAVENWRRTGVITRKPKAHKTLESDSDWGRHDLMDTNLNLVPWQVCGLLLTRERKGTEQGHLFSCCLPCLCLSLENTRWCSLTLTLTVSA